MDDRHSLRTPKTAGIGLGPNVVLLGTLKAMPKTAGIALGPNVVLLGIAFGPNEVWSTKFGVPSLEYRVWLGKISISKGRKCYRQTEEVVPLDYVRGRIR